MTPADCEEGQTDKDVNKPRGSNFPESSDPDKANGKLSLTMTVSNMWIQSLFAMQWRFMLTSCGDGCVCIKHDVRSRFPRQGQRFGIVCPA